MELMTEKFNLCKIIASDKNDGHSIGLLLGGLPFVFGGTIVFVLAFVLQIESFGLRIFLIIFGLFFIAGGVYVFCWGIFVYKYFKKLFLNGERYSCSVTGISKGYVEDGEGGGSFLYCFFYTFILSGKKISRKSPYCYTKRQVKKIEGRNFYIRYSKERDEAIYFRP